MLKNTSFQKLFAIVGPGLKSRWPAVLAVMALAAVATIGLKAPLLLLQPLFDRVLFPQQVPDGGLAESVGAIGAASRLQERFNDWFFGPRGSLSDKGLQTAALWRVVLVSAVLTAVASLGTYLFTLLSRWLAIRMVVDLRLRLTKHLLRLSMRYHGQRKLGDLLSRISSDVGTTLMVVTLIFKDLTREPLLVVASLGVAFAAAPEPTIAVLILLPLVLLPIALLGKRVKRRSKKSLTELGASMQVLTQMFQGIRTVKAFRAEERELERYREVNETYVRSAMRMVRAIATIQGTTMLLSQVGFSVVLLLVGWASIHWGKFQSGGEMLQFFGGIGMIYNHVKRITSATNSVQEAAGAAERLQQLLEETEDIVERPDAIQLTSLGSGVRVEGVELTYPDQPAPALKDVTLDLRPGETLALVGPSGAGKSSLIDVLARFLDPTAGRVTVDGHDLRDASLDSWCSLYAMVGQHPFLFHASILENIRYGKPDASQAEIEEAARAANIHDFILSLPEGYDTMVGDAGSRLSGGQRQRLTIARAVLKGAPLLFLDEATSALDTESERVVQEALDRLMADRTVLVIAHRLSTIRNADRIAVLEEGRLVELGSHTELLEKRGAYARLHNVQFATAPEVGA